MLAYQNILRNYFIYIFTTVLEPHEGWYKYSSKFSRFNIFLLLENSKKCNNTRDNTTDNCTN